MRGLTVGLRACTAGHPHLCGWLLVLGHRGRG